MKCYAQIFITNLPSFYKIRLYNHIASRQKIFVIFTETSEADRNEDFYKGKCNFDYVNIGNLGKISKMFAVAKLLLSSKYKMLVIGGWDSLANWCAAFVSAKKHNALVIESSVFESSTGGIKGFLKRVFMSRISTVFASGIAQRELARALHFGGNIITTKGVGIFNIRPQAEYKYKSEIKNFIYVGRFVACKNLEFLLSAFAKLPNLNLTLVGFGNLEAKLKSAAPRNVSFTGAVDNDKLWDYYKKSDVLILPSLSEPWGLVVEEAFNNGIPALTSVNVGCNGEVAVEGENSLHFSPSDENSLIAAIKKICDPEIYNKLALNISKYNFEDIAMEQVKKYIIP